MSRFGVLGPKLHRAGWDVIPIPDGEKRPAFKRWQHGLSAEQVDHYAANGYARGSVGLLARGFPAVDVDVLDAECALAVQALALEVLGDAPVRVGKPPKRLLMYRCDTAFAKVKVNLAGPGEATGIVEVLSDGQQYLIYGRHPEGHEYEWVLGSGPGDDCDVWQLTAIDQAAVNRLVQRLSEPGALPQGWSVVGGRQSGGAAVAQNGEGEDAFALLKAPLEGWPLERVVTQVLPHLDPNMLNDQWAVVGMALHHQGQGGEEWLQAWDEWSQPGHTWAEGECAYRWGSFKDALGRGAGGVTLATLLKWSRDAREKAERSEREAVTAAVEASTDVREIEVDLAQGRIAAMRWLSVAEREVLVGLVAKRLKDLGAAVSLSIVRKWCEHKPVPAGTGAVGAAGAVSAPRSAAPEWAQDWCYLTNGDKFFNLRTKQEVTATGFRALFNRLMPFDRDGNRERADQAAIELWDIPTAAFKAYLPSAGPVFELLGLRWVNLYRPESAPAMPDSLSEQEQAAVQLVSDHLAVMFEDPREQRLLLSWIAHNVQKIGVKIRWAPYLHGVPGDGKSFFADLMASALGGQNVVPLNARVLESQFNEWASGAAVVAIEEMKQHGHNRHDVMNSVKPLITNDTVNIHPKGKAAYAAPNVTNYIIFSNFLDGAPIDATDRRYMFLSSRLSEDGARQLTEQGYYKRLFDAARLHPGAMRKWLMELPLDAEFDANGRAPMTRIRATVVAASKSDLEWAIEDVLAKGAPGVCREVISSSHFTAALRERGLEAPATKAVRTTLANLGFEYLEKRKRWAGDMRNLWVKRGLGLTPEKAVEILEKTLIPEEFLK